MSLTPSASVREAPGKLSTVAAPDGGARNPAVTPLDEVTKPATSPALLIAAATTLTPCTATSENFFVAIVYR